MESNMITQPGSKIRELATNFQEAFKMECVQNRRNNGISLNTENKYVIFLPIYRDRIRSLKTEKHQGFSSKVIRITKPTVKPKLTIECNEEGYYILLSTSFINTLNYSKSIFLEFPFLSHTFQQDLILDECHNHTIEDIVKRIFHRYKQPSQYSMDLIMLGMIELFMNLKMLCLFKEKYYLNKSPESTSIAGAFLGFLEQHFMIEHSCTPINVSDIANHLKVSQSQLNKHLRETVGKSAKMIINHQLIINAKNRLLNSTNTVSEISYQLGFDNPSYFCRFFKKKTGSTPNKFRQLEVNTPRIA